MPLPNFILIGPTKSGSTSLFHYLNQHPEIYLSPVKEPGYFLYGDEGIRPWPDPISGNYTADTLEKYKALFDGVTNEKAIGEATVTYFSDPYVPGRIHKLLPDVKLVAVLRHPAERAFSTYVMFRGLIGLDEEPTFEAAVEKELRENVSESEWGRSNFLETSFYSRRLSRYYELFPKENIKILLFDDLQKEPEAFLSELAGFLGVDPSFNFDLQIKHNRSGIPKSKWIHQVSYKDTGLVRRISRLFPDKFRDRMKDLYARANLERQTLAPETREWLTGLYREDILKLNAMIDKDVSHWL